MLSVGCSGDIGELEKFFDGGKYGRNWVLKMVCCLLDYVLAFEEFMGHQLTIFFLEVSEHVCHGVLNGVCRAILDIREICLLDCGDDLLQEGLLNSRHFAKKTHFLGVCNSHV